MKAKDLMIPLQEYLRPETTLKDAANTLMTAKRDEEKQGVKGLPVLDDKDRMVGFISMGDILKSVFPSYLSLMNLGDFTWDGMVEDMAKKAANKKVGEMMTKEVITVHEDSSLMECVDHMLKNKIKRLPVLNKEGKVTGMIYERDIFFAITKAMGQEESAK